MIGRRINCVEPIPALVAVVSVSAPARLVVSAFCFSFSHFVMFSRAACSAASRRAAASAHSLRVDLDLSGPTRPCPLIVGDEPEAPSMTLPDLAASSAPAPQDVLPPASALSADQEDFRRQILDEVRLTFEACAASGAVRTYEAILRGIAPKATLKLGPPVLPMATEAQFLSFFGAALLLGPKSPFPVSGVPGVRWNYVKLVKAAAAHWRVVRGERAVFDAEWSPRMGVFWTGVERKCVRFFRSKRLRYSSRAFASCVVGLRSAAPA